jgi:hypothetical protein
MDKNEFKICFAKILSNNISPYFKDLKYKKAGNNFKYFNEIGKIVNFQKSQYYNTRFTINIGIYLPEFEYYFYDNHKISNEKFNESICAIRKRIGKLKKLEKDYWYELDEETEIENLKNELEDDIKNKIIPFLNRFNDKKNILEQLFMERYTGVYELARIKVLYKNGFNAEIKNMINSENYQ